MTRDIEKNLSILVKLLMTIAVVAGIYFLGPTVIYAILPFLFGWLITLLITPSIRFMERKLKLSKSFAALVSLTLFLVVTLSVVSMIGGMIIYELTDFSKHLPEFSKLFYGKSQLIIEQIEDLYIQLPENISEGILTGFNAFLEKLTSLLSIVIASILNFVSGIPQFVVFLIVTVIAAYFMARDRASIERFVLAQMKNSWLSNMKLIKQDLLGALFGYIRAQLILMFFTFVQSIIGLLIIGIDYAFLAALAASLLDALPILGTGSVYVPMMIWYVIQGKYKVTIAIGVLYGVIILVRQLLEPKILGKQIGLHPLLTLVAMYVGLQIFGVFGLIIGPVMLIILLTLQKIGILPQWRTNSR
ncbi:MAG: sporulation integral membrane protein YtvI [Bacillota bacterium]